MAVAPALTRSGLLYVELSGYFSRDFSRALSRQRQAWGSCFARRASSEGALTTVLVILLAFDLERLLAIDRCDERSKNAYIRYPVRGRGLSLKLTRP